MGERRLKIADVARDTGLNRGTVTRLYNETASRIDLNDIEVLCRYFEVGVSDMFELILDENES
jgi:putative transcriptional regulator